jgi:hypothetical membrane protein
MDNITRQLKGDFKPHELRRYLVFEILFFWGLIFACWRIFPEENAFSIMTHTFSFLGSFDSHRNPGGWWLFTIAMTSWGLATVPVALYLQRCFSPISARGARAGARLLLTGALGIVLVGIFPDARGVAVGNWHWGDFHKIAALFLVVGFLFGIPLFGVLLLKDRFSSEPKQHNHTRLLGPYFFFASITGIALTFLITWIFVYADMQAAAKVSGTAIGSSWTEAMGTRYSFPLWDNVFLYTLFISLIWIPLVAPKPNDGRVE